MGPRTHNGTINPSVHPQFRSKAVCGLSCNHCESNLCDRGMRAILLGNTTIELFSTDIPPFGVALVDKDYFTKNCSCRIRDAACLGCGNVVGYHVTHPCEKCLEACNNGHFWMFLSEAVRPVERYEKNGTKVLRWSAISDSPNGGEAVVEQEAGQLCR
ncbi:protein FAM72 [Globomyces pollinis-pini]|nr:protein FAM72 [Globomyces pollinis-pini]